MAEQAAEQKATFDAQLAKANTDAAGMKMAYDKASRRRPAFLDVATVQAHTSLCSLSHTHTHRFVIL